MIVITNKKVILSVFFLPSTYKIGHDYFVIINVLCIFLPLPNPFQENTLQKQKTSLRSKHAKNSVGEILVLYSFYTYM